MMIVGDGQSLEETAVIMPESPSMGRTIATLLIMLVAFAALSAFFLAIDNAAGVHVHVPIFVAASSTRTPTPHPTATRPTPSATSAASSITGTATLTPADAISIPSAQSTLPVLPTPPDGITPPRYGSSPNYINNTTFTADFLQQLDDRIVALTNEQRVAHGLSKLTQDAGLGIVAAARSQDMIKRGYFDHFDPTGLLDAQGHHAAAVQELLTRNSISYSEVGENLVGNTGYPLDDTTPKQVVQAWMNHPEHRANILHAGYTTIGVGMAVENQSNGLRVIITQIFIR